MTFAPCDVRDAFALKVESGIFNPVARHLREDLRDDRLAEGIGLTFEKYARECAHGVVMDDALLVHVCRLRATDLSRRVAGSDGARPKGDVLDDRNRTHLEFVHLDDFDEVACHAVALSTNPTRSVQSAIDLGAWLSGLEEDDRRLLAMRQAGHTLAEIGRAIDASTSAVFARLRRLGQALAEWTGSVEYSEGRG